MRKSRRIASLLLALTLALSIAVPAMAYDAQSPEKFPADEWTVSTVFHWVVRGDTLQAIADKYGTTVDEIVDYNEAYFKDLNSRNTTTGLNIVIEPGVRLKIYDQVTVVHYVRRGDTLAALAGGALSKNGFTLTTTEAAIVEQNRLWFNELNEINTTLGANFSLVESDQIIIKGYREFTDRFFPSDSSGTPLYITVPVRADFNTTLNSPFKIREYYYLRNLTELYSSVLDAANPALGTAHYIYQVPNSNLYPSNFMLDESQLHWYQEPFPDDNVRISDSRYVPGMFDKKTVTQVPSSTPTAVKNKNRYDAVNGSPTDAQQDGTVAYFNNKKGSGAQILADIAKSYNTTTARIRALNPGYFSYLDANGVSLEANVWIWVPAK